MRRVKQTSKEAVRQLLKEAIRDEVMAQGEYANLSDRLLHAGGIEPSRAIDFSLRIKKIRKDEAKHEESLRGIAKKMGYV